MAWGVFVACGVFVAVAVLVGIGVVVGPALPVTFILSNTPVARVVVLLPVTAIPT